MALDELRSRSSKADRRAERELLAEHWANASVPGGTELSMGAADQWLATLLDQPVKMSSGLGDDGSPSFCEPRAIVGMVLEYRTSVASDWIEQLRQVPEMLLQVKRDHVTRQAGW